MDDGFDFVFVVIILSGLAQIAILLFFIVKMNAIAGGVREIAGLMTGRDFKRDFYKYVAAAQKEKAKEVLFDEISRTAEFRQIISGADPKTASVLSDSIRKRYEKELSIVGCQDRNFALLA